MSRLLRTSVLSMLAGLTALATFLAPFPTSTPLALAAPGEQAACVRAEPPMPAPGTPGATGFWARYREPLPPAEVYNPPGPKRVGLQAGHWLTHQIPAELRGLGPGASAAGRDEWEVNLDVAERTAAILRGYGVEVDVLPTTLPVEYKAHAFVSIHADGDPAGARRGYKLGRAVWSAVPAADDRLISTIEGAYGEATLLPIDPAGPSRRMTAYYAFNSRRYCHAVAPVTPSVILEMGYMTHAADRQLLYNDPDAAARGIAVGLLRFLDIPE